MITVSCGGRGRVLAALSLALTMTAASASSPGAQVPQGVETFDAAWRIIRDSHFDKAMNGVDWDAVSRELRPKAETARTPGELRAVIRDMLGRLGQSHFALLPATADSAEDTPKDLSGTPGFDVRLLGGDLIVTEVDANGAAATAGVRTGWKVQTIDGSAVSALLASLPESLAPRLRNVEAWRLAHTRLHGPSGSRAAITFEDGTGTATSLEVERRVEGGQPVTVGNLPTMFVRVKSARAATPAGRTAGVIAFNVWMTAVDPLFSRPSTNSVRATGS